MSLRPQNRERGLAALNEARQVRRRAIVFGRVRVREVATGFWLMAVAGLLVFSFAYYRYTLVELDAKKSQVLSQQRAVASAVGNGALELREKLERWVMELGSGKLAPLVAAGVELDQLARGPAVYVRLPLVEAASAESIRKAAARSLRDGFTSCLFVNEGSDPSQGSACTQNSQCGPGEVCNDWRACAAPAHPYNLRLLYDGLHVLDPTWESGLAAANDDLEVRAIELDLQATAKHEAVAAVELARRARYFTAVLDAPSPGEPAAAAAVGPGESASERLQAIDHPVRVGIWDIQRGAALAVLQLEAAGRFVRLGAHTADEEALRAQQRQANNCAIATDVRAALAAGRVDPPESAPGGAPAGLVAGE